MGQTRHNIYIRFNLRFKAAQMNITRRYYYSLAACTLACLIHLPTSQLFAETRARRITLPAGVSATDYLKSLENDLTEDYGPGGLTYDPRPSTSNSRPLQTSSSDSDVTYDDEFLNPNQEPQGPSSNDSDVTYDDEFLNEGQEPQGPTTPAASNQSSSKPERPTQSSSSRPTGSRPSPSNATPQSPSSSPQSFPQQSSNGCNPATGAGGISNSPLLSAANNNATSNLLSQIIQGVGSLVSAPFRAIGSLLNGGPQQGLNTLNQLGNGLTPNNSMGNQIMGDLTNSLISTALMSQLFDGMGNMPGGNMLAGLLASQAFGGNTGNFLSTLLTGQLLSSLFGGNNNSSQNSRPVRNSSVNNRDSSTVGNTGSTATGSTSLNRGNSSSSNSGSSSQPTPTPGAGDRFQYQLSGNIKDLNVRTVFLDLFDTSAAEIAAIKAQGKQVICYMSAGTAENWRPDFNEFTSRGLLGDPYDAWPGEYWVDITKPATFEIMRNRLELAKQKGCTGVDPDNTDGYSNATGLVINQQQTQAYLESLANAAHALGLTIGLKNTPELASALADDFDWAVTEECAEYNFCAAYDVFIELNKPVYQIEYSSRSERVCFDAFIAGRSVNFTNLQLDGNINFC